MGNRSKKSQSLEEQALYKRPLRAAQQSLMGLRNSFATQQRRLLNQLQQQMSAKDSRSDELTVTPPNNVEAELPPSQQTPKKTLRTTLRDTPKPAKSSNIVQESTLKSALRKGKATSAQGQMGPREQAIPSTQQKRGEASSPTTESDDDLQLDAPPPKSYITTVEGLSELMFSTEHLKYIIQDQILYTRFSLFLVRYRPQLIPVLLHYIEIQKAMKALEYANAVASSLGPFPGENDSQGIETAFVTNKELDERQERVVDLLMNEALPAQINFSLVDVVTDAMQKVITGKQQTPIMQNLIGGLTEVFTLTDPSIQDNPIIYASEEFYNMTGYGRDFVIGRNCRFLQGPKTSHQSIQRLKTSIDDGVEISETMLNYRRDGTPFMNLLLVAPLHDNKGNIKYYIGAQVDVTGLVEQGQGLDGFDAFLDSRKKQDVLKKHGARDERGLALQKLAELSEMFDLMENSIVRAHSRSNSLTRDSGYGSSNQLGKSGTNNRRIIIEESPSDEDEYDEDESQSQITESRENKQSNWKLAAPGVPTGQLPGVYQKYLLLRPAPSLKVIFVSPGLRKLAKLSKKRFLDCVDGSRGTMEGMREAFEAGVPVSAKVSWKGDDSITSVNSEKKEKGKSKRDTWISATPMLGSDTSIGVWIIIVVQNPGATKSRPGDNTQNMRTTTSSDVMQPQEIEVSALSDEKQKPEGSNSETNVNGDQDQEQASTTQARPKSTSIPNGANTTPKRNNINIHSFTQSIQVPPTPDSDTDETSTTQPLAHTNTRMSGSTFSTNHQPGDIFLDTNGKELAALQDSAEIERNRNSRGKGRDVVAMGRVRIMNSSEDEEVEDDSRVDTVDEEGGGGSEKGGNGSEVSKEKVKAKVKGEVGETWSPPSKNIWVKPPRPTLRDRMMSVD